jgi:lysophospholipase L1-like esterase
MTAERRELTAPLFSPPFEGGAGGVAATSPPYERSGENKSARVGGEAEQAAPGYKANSSPPLSKQGGYEGDYPPNPPFERGREDISPSGVTKTSRWLRRLGWAYLAGLHVVVATLVFYPHALERLVRYWNHDPSVMADYQGRVEAQAVVCAGMPDRSIVFLGDSRLRDLPIRDVAEGPAINLSIGGDTVKGLLGRLPRYARLESARRVVVGVGVNDLSHFSDDELLNNYRTLLTYLVSRSAKITITAIFPINEAKYTQANATYLSGQTVTNARIDRVNGSIEDLCRQYAQVDFVDANAELAGADGNLRDEYSVDGLHLTAAGNAAWAAALRKRLPPE